MNLWRIGTILIAASISIVWVSGFMVINNHYGVEGNYDPGEIRSVILSLAGDVHVEVETPYGGRVSVYVLTWQDTLLVAQNKSLNGTKPVIQRVNTTSCDEVLSVPLPGLYSFVVTPVLNQTTYVRANIYRVVPQGMILTSGLLCAICGVILILPSALNRFRRASGRVIGA